MKIRLRMGRGLFFLCFFLFAVVALLPLRLALHSLGLDARGFAAREASGSIWLGTISEAQFGPVALGDVTAQLRTLPLLVGRARIDLERSGDPNPFEAGLTISRHVFGLDDASARIDTGATGLPVASLELADVSAHFADGQCRSAEGLIKASIAGNLGGITLPAGLSGDARCDGGALLLPVVSQAGSEALNIRLFEDGRYRVELVLKSADPTLRDRLVAGGFIASGTGYVLRTQGRF